MYNLMVSTKSIKWWTDECVNRTICILQNVPTIFIEDSSIRITIWITISNINNIQITIKNSIALLYHYQHDTWCSSKCKQIKVVYHMQYRWKSAVSIACVIYAFHITMITLLRSLYSRTFKSLISSSLTLEIQNEHCAV